MISIEEILNFLDRKNIMYSFIGEKNVKIDGFSFLKNYKWNTVTWAKNDIAYQFDFEEKLLVVAQTGLQINAKNVITAKESKLIFFL